MLTFFQKHLNILWRHNRKIKINKTDIHCYSSFYLLILFVLSAHKLHPQNPPDHDSVSSAVAKRWRGRERIHFEEKWERKKRKRHNHPSSAVVSSCSCQSPWLERATIHTTTQGLGGNNHSQTKWPFSQCVCVREKRVQGGQDRGMLPALSDHLTVQSTATVLTFPKPR